MRILITGGAGFIGSHLAEALLGAGHSHVVIEKLRLLDFTDLAPNVFASERNVRFREGGYAVPRDVLVDVLTELRRWVDRHDERVSFPVVDGISPERQGGKHAGRPGTNRQPGPRTRRDRRYPHPRLRPARPLSACAHGAGSGGARSRT